MPLLEVEHLSVTYGLARAVEDVSLTVNAGELIALVGANGAGKTSTLLGISGVLPGARGRVTLDGQRLDNRPPQAVAAAGIVHVPEGRQLFPDMSVRENLELGAYVRSARAHRRQRMADALDLMPRLRDRLNQRAGSLSGGEQQMVAIARGLMADPRVIILDEPTLGLAPLYVRSVFETIELIRSRGTAILLVEQNVNYALKVANRGYVMQTGRVVMEGPAAELLRRKDLSEAVLGAG